MKKFTRLFIAIVGALTFCVQASNAAVTKASDLFGTYKFTATVTLTNKGRLVDGLEVALKTECDAVIGEMNYAEMGITGILGTTTQQPVSGFNASGNLHLINPNAYGYLFAELNACMGDENGLYSGVEMDYTFDPNTKTITLPDFTVVYPQEGWPTGVAGTILANVTNAKLEFVGGSSPEEPVRSDLSGAWTFAKGDGDWDVKEDSDLPATYTLTLASKNETNSEYDATISIEGIDGEAVLTATFDGTTLMMDYNYVLFGSTYYYLADANSGASVTESVIKYSVTGENAMDVMYGFVVAYLGTGAQWYNGGTMTRSAVGEPHDFTGTYRVTPANVYNVDKMGYSYCDQGQSFTFTVEDKDGVLVITEWMGMDVFNNSAGAAICTVSGNKLNIATGQQYRIHNSAGTPMLVDVLCDIGGSMTDPIIVTLDADDALSIDDFGIQRVARTYTSWTEWTDDKEDQPNCWYINNTIEKVTSGPSVGVDDVKSAAGVDSVYNLSGQRMDSKRLSRGIYIINGKKVAL